MKKILLLSLADSIESLNKKYNALENGKWGGMMTVPPGFCAKYQERPPLRRFGGIGEEDFSKNLSIRPDKDIRCHTLSLNDATLGNGARLIEGIGYVGSILQLGDPAGDNPGEAYLNLGALDGEDVKLQIFHLPYFPLYEGHGCRIGVSVDDGEEQTIEYLPEEWSKPWKLNVLRNSALSELVFPLSDARSSHTLRLRAIDPGMAIQRIVIDEGGFRPGYVGPEPQ